MDKILNLYYFVFILAIFSIWISVLVGIVLVFGAMGYVAKERKNKVDLDK